MKNNAGFKVGDKVRYLTPTVGGVKSLRGLTGTIKYVNDMGAEVAFKTTNGVKNYALANYFDLIDGLRDFTDIQSQPRPKNTPTQSSWGWGFDVVNKDDLKYYKMPQLWLS